MITYLNIFVSSLQKTKVSLLKGEGRASSDERSLKSEDAAEGNLVDLSGSPTTSQPDSLAIKGDPERVAALEGDQMSLLASCNYYVSDKSHKK